MSSAETTHPIEWRDDGQGGWDASIGQREVGQVSPFGMRWMALVFGKRSRTGGGPAVLFDAASAARSFVEKSVKEAGHGE